MQEKFDNLEALETIVQTLDRAELRPVTVSSETANRYVAIWNTSRNNLETIVQRRDSTLIQHQDAFNSFIRTARQKNIAMSGVLKNFGGHVIIEGTFENVKIMDGSKLGINMGVQLENNYDARGYPNFTGQGFGIRGVCSNGCIFGGMVSHIFTKHGKVSQLDKYMMAFVGDVMDTLKIISGYIETAQKDVIPKDDDVKAILMGELWRQQVARKVYDLLESRDSITRYDIYNGITNYSTHYAETETHKARLQKIAQRVLINPVDNLNRGIWDKKS